MIDPLAYGYTTLLRRTAANAGDMDFMGTSALVMVVMPTLPVMEALGQIGWWLFAGEWPTAESTRLLGRSVSWTVPFSVPVLAIVAYGYYRSREQLITRFGSFPIPTTGRVAALLIGVVGTSIVLGYLCLADPLVGLAVYAAVFLASSWLLSRMERRQA